MVTNWPFDCRRLHQPSLASHAKVARRSLGEVGPFMPSELRLASPSSRVVRLRPWRSMDVWLWLTNSERFTTFSPVGAAASCQRRPPAHARRGVTSGGTRQFGGIDTLRASATRPHYSPMTSPLAIRRSPSPQELVREANSYNRPTCGRPRRLVAQSSSVHWSRIRQAGQLRHRITPTASPHATVPTGLRRRSARSTTLWCGAA
jgi:hypothetical protein